MLKHNIITWAMLLSLYAEPYVDVSKIQIKSKDCWHQKFIGWFLKTFRITEYYDDFYSTFYLFGHGRIYVSQSRFEAIDLENLTWEQTRILVHELRHIQQMSEDFLFALKYGLSSKHREEFEVDAYAGEFPLRRAFSEDYQEQSLWNERYDYIRWVALTLSRNYGIPASRMASIRGNLDVLLYRVSQPKAYLYPRMKLAESLYQQSLTPYPQH